MCLIGFTKNQKEVPDEDLEIVKIFSPLTDIGPNHLLLAMLQTFVWQHCQWHCLQKNFCLELPNSVRNEKKFLEAMPLAMLPTKSLQHCKDQMIRAIIFWIVFDISLHSLCATIYLVVYVFTFCSKIIFMIEIDILQTHYWDISLKNDIVFHACLENST